MSEQTTGWTHDVTLLGCGAMGRRMVANLLASGRRVAVWNRSPINDDGGFLAGAERIPTPAEAAGAAPVVVAMVRDDDASAEVWFGDAGAAEGLLPGSWAIETSTLSPAWTSELDGRLTAAGHCFLAGPVLGSTPQAEAGQLVQLIGAHSEVPERVAELLGVNATRTVDVGDPATAAHYKLVVNGWLAGQVALASELVRRLEDIGTSRKQAVSFISDLPLTSAPLQGVLGRVAAGDHDPRFPIGLVAKDINYLRDAGLRSGGQGTTMLDAMARAWSDAAAIGPGQDIAAYLHTLDGAG